MNSLECRLLKDGSKLIKVLQWTNMWDAVGIMGLSTSDVPLLQKFMDYVSGFGAGVMEYAAVPKEFVVEDSTLSTILRNTHRSLDLESFPMALYHRNPELRGGHLCVTHSRCYGAGDKTRAGQPKEGWRLLFLKGCPIFLKKLSKFPESHRFTLGSSGVQIWGGERRPEENNRTGPRYGNQQQRSQRGTMSSGNNTAGPSGLIYGQNNGRNGNKGKSNGKNLPKSSARPGAGTGNGGQQGQAAPSTTPKAKP